MGGHWFLKSQIPVIKQYQEMGPKKWAVFVQIKVKTGDNIFI